MSEQFFERPILNSPYSFPRRHWELDADGQPTHRIIEARRRSDLITPVPKPKKRRKSRDQAQMVFDDDAGLTTEEQEYNPTPIINEVRTYVETWRNLPNSDQWHVTPLGKFGRWAFAEFTAVYEIEREFDTLIASLLPPARAA